jgi:hypothetical protein
MQCTGTALLWGFTCAMFQALFGLWIATSESAGGLLYDAWRMGRGTHGRWICMLGWVTVKAGDACTLLHSSKQVSLQRLLCSVQVHGQLGVAVQAGGQAGGHGHLKPGDILLVLCKVCDIVR